MKLLAQHNYGVDILRIWMCFVVINCHFSHDTSIAPAVIDFFRLFENVAVAIFMFVSFLLCAQILNGRLQGRKIVGRIKRIAIPIVFWGLFYYALCHVIHLLTGKGLTPTVGDLAMQLLGGYVYNLPMWFMNVLLALTLTVVVINLIVPQKLQLHANVLFTVAALAFSLFGFTGRCVGELSAELREPLGRYFEMMPYAGMANILYLTGFSTPTGRRRLFYCAILALCCWTLWMFREVEWPYKTFGNSSPYQYAFTVASVLLMSALPFEYIGAFLRKIISWTAHYTLGIYCMHIAVGGLFNAACSFMGLPKGTVVGSLTIFAISLTASCAIAHIPVSWAKKTVS